MALSNTATLSSKSLYGNTQSLSAPHHHHQPTFSVVPTTTKTHSAKPLTRISAVHAAEPSTKPTPAASPSKWTVESWKTKPALQLPEYPDQQVLETVLKTIEAFPPLVFAGEARHLEEKLAEAAMGNAFLLQGGDCAESFKEFNANNIRDTFRVLLQMGAVLMFGGQVPVIRVGIAVLGLLSFCILVCLCVCFWLIV
jgi:3-deoxy-7-phosphoheptulonate synthase